VAAQAQRDVFPTMKSFYQSIAKELMRISRVAAVRLASCKYCDRQAYNHSPVAELSAAVNVRWNGSAPLGCVAQSNRERRVGLGATQKGMWCVLMCCGTLSAVDCEGIGR
jgi:hypothetical protein